MIKHITNGVVTQPVKIKIDYNKFIDLINSTVSDIIAQAIQNQTDTHDGDIYESDDIDTDNTLNYDGYYTTSYSETSFEATYDSPAEDDIDKYISELNPNLIAKYIAEQLDDKVKLSQLIDISIEEDENNAQYEPNIPDYNYDYD